MNLTLFWREGKTKGGREKERKKKKKNLRVHYVHPKDEVLTTNVNDSMDAGGMGAADVTQTSEQVKSREVLTKHWFKEP